MDTPFDSTLESDIKELLTEVPPPIRAFFVSGKVEIVAKNLMQKYQLHIDQGAIMEREIILLLLGLKNPTEFTQTLAGEAKIEQPTVNNIVQDINTQIFIPLQEEEKKNSVPEPTEYFHLENKLPPRPSAPVAPKLLSDEKLLEDREEPHIEINKIPPSILPRTAPPPANLPGVMTPPVQPKPIPSIPPVPAKPYSTDPYREPIDENSKQ